MIYIYDILLNLNSKLIEFFEWEDNDKIIHVKKIPIYRVDDLLINNIINDKIIVNNNFLNIIRNKTELYNCNVDNYKYLVLFTNNKIIVGVSFASNGVEQSISRLLIDEEKEILVLAERLDITNISFEYIKTDREKSNNLTRKEQNIKDNLTREIINLYKNNNIEKLNYLYYEYFNNICNNKKLVYKDLIDSITNNFNSKHLLLYDIMKMSKSL